MPKITQLELVGRRAGTQARGCQLPNQDPLARPHGFSQQGKASLQSSFQKQQLPGTEPAAKTIHNAVSVDGCQPQGTRTASLRNPNSKGPRQLSTTAPSPRCSPRTDCRWPGCAQVHPYPHVCVLIHTDMHARTHTHTHTHTPHRAFHPQRQPALPGTQSLAEPGREREGLAERILRNSGPVNTSFGDLIRPPPGQQQAGEKADNGRHGDWTHPGMPSSFWNKRSSARPGWEEGLWYYLPQTSQHRWVSL